MDFFEKLGNKINDVGHNTIQKTKEFSRVNQINGQISNAQKTRGDLLRRMGELYYEQYKEDHDSVFNELFEEIAKTESTIDSLRAEVMLAKGLVKCPKCGMENPNTSAFCSGCGERLPVQQGQPQASAAFCQNCGKPLEAGVMFCTSCGTPVNASPASAPSAGAQSYGAHAGSEQSYGVPTGGAQGYGVPSGSAQGYGVPSGGEQSYGVPSGGAQGYGVPSGGAQGYGVPSGGAQGYGVPSGGAQGYGVPTGGEQGFAATSESAPAGDNAGGVSLSKDS